MAIHKYHLLTLVTVCIFFAIPNIFAQKVNEFPKKTDPLYKKVEMFDALMLGNHWNEGAIMQHVIFPPAGLEQPIVGSQADCLDPTSEMLAAYSHKYAITQDSKDRKIANEIFEAILKLEKVTGVEGLVARSFNRTNEPLWHEEVMWYHEWHQSSSMPGYRWLGDLSADKFTSIFYGVGTFWELCADAEYKEKGRSLLNKYRMNLNRHWYDWKDIEFTWESNIWFLMVYKVLTGEDILQKRKRKV